MEYQHLIKHANKEIKERWKRLFSNENGNLAQGTGRRLKGTDTFYFIKNKEMMV